MNDLDTRHAAALAGELLEQAPRVLGWLDREPDSRTAGCMDRTYWAWKFTDFPGSRFQEGVCFLSFLHTRRLEGSRYVAHPALLGWIEQALDWWCGLQHRDGSFDEAYPFERSLAATAFGSFYVAEALEMLGGTGGGESPVAARARTALARAGRWLAQNDETHGFLSNHLAAAAAALYHIYRITGDSVFATRSRHFRDRILARQSDEGWYDEYAGADPGYQSHGSFYLVRLWQLSGDEELAASLDRAMTFMSHFVHPDGSLGGEYASRNTQMYYPAAFEMFASRSRASSWIAERMRLSVIGDAAVGMKAVDAYNFFPMLNNLVFAYRAVSSGHVRVPAVEPESGLGLAWFPKAGIARIRRERYDAYVGAAKGGVIKAWSRDGRLILSDCGWVGRTFDGRLASTQYQDATRPMSAGFERVEVEGHLYQSSRPVMSSARFIAFRVFTLTIGRWALVGRWLKLQLVRVLIYRRKKLPVEFRRTIEFADDRITITDDLSGDHEGRLNTLERRPLFTTIHMGSSRYFVPNDLEAMRPDRAPGAAVERHDPARIGEGLHVVHTVEV